MSKVIPIRDKKTLELLELSEYYNEVSEAALKLDMPLTDIAGIMANRLGELVRVYDGDKEGLKGMLYNIIHDRAYMEKD